MTVMVRFDIGFYSANAIPVITHHSTTIASISFLTENVAY
jgi:hypothetical protein